ncbi:MAG: hypothetical protein AB7F94_00355 [Nitrospira sp.]
MGRTSVTTLLVPKALQWEETAGPEWILEGIEIKLVGAGSATIPGVNGERDEETGNSKSHHAPLRWLLA